MKNKDAAVYKAFAELGLDFNKPDIPNDIVNDIVDRISDPDLKFIDDINRLCGDQVNMQDINDLFKTESE